MRLILLTEVSDDPSSYVDGDMYDHGADGDGNGPA